jgi:hypothetical protein
MPAEGDPPIVPAPAPAPAPAAWHAAFASDPDTAAYITSKGLDKLPSINDAFKQVSEFHKQAEGYIGIPASERLRAPNAADPAAVKAFWAKFGVPDTSEGYDFSTMKRADGSDIQPELAGAMRAAAHQANVPTEAAQKLLGEVVKFQDGQAAAAAQATKTALETARANLTREWGPNYSANLALADRAAKALGVDVDTSALLAEKLGADKVLEMFRKIGASTAEDTFVSSPNKEGGDAPVTITEAKQTLDARKSDPEWVKKLIAGDYQVNQEYQKVMRSAYPDLYAAEQA